MFDFKKFLAVFLGKLVRFFVQRTKSGGTAAPGLAALKIDPQLLLKFRKQLKFSIFISGTNGKTTSARMCSFILKSANIPFFHNRTGSNLLRGIASTLIDKSNFFGNISRKIGLWEVDEAVLSEAINQIRPKIVVLTNLFRDQLDRYGEIDSLAKKWEKALNKLPADSTVILNADDPIVASLGKGLTCKVIYYGIKDKSIGSKFLSHASDAVFCPYCSLPLNYEISFLSHLGIYKCPKCKSIQPKTKIYCTQVSFLKEKGIQISIKSPLGQHIFKAPVSGIYNIYNILTGFSIASVLKIDAKKIIQGFKNFRPAFGRFEKIKINNKNLKMFLVKNPTGFNEVIKTISKINNRKSVCLIALNDLIADGQDVSWIWDVDMEELAKIKFKKVIVSGRRAYDMALRVKHAKISCHSGASAIESKKRSYRPSDSRMTEKNSFHDDKNTKFVIESNLRNAINLLLKDKNKELFILPTYTAMLEIRKILAKMGLVHSTWED